MFFNSTGVTMKRLAVFVSGSGTLLAAMIKDGLPIALVLADRECRGIEIAKESGIPTEIITREKYGFGSQNYPFCRDEYTREITEVLLRNDIEIVAMAGFMTVLHKEIFGFYKDKILNSHPSLLPSFKGEHAVRDALEFGVKMTGTTIHVATEELDNGPILAQASVPVLEGDTVEMLWERIKVVERVLYAKTIRDFAGQD